MALHHTSSFVCVYLCIQARAQCRRGWDIHFFFAVFYWKNTGGVSTWGYDYELVLIQRKTTFWLPVNCSESKCHLHFLGSALFPTASKYRIFKLIAMKFGKQWGFHSHCHFAALYVMLITVNDTLLAWQEVQKCCWNVEAAHCSAISCRKITSINAEFHMVSEALSAMPVYHNYPLLFPWHVLENEKQAS